MQRYILGENPKPTVPPATNNPKRDAVYGPSFPEKEYKEDVDNSAHPVRRGWDYHGF